MSGYDSDHSEDNNSTNINTTTNHTTTHHQQNQNNHSTNNTTNSNTSMVGAASPNNTNQIDQKPYITNNNNLTNSSLLYSSSSAIASASSPAVLPGQTSSLSSHFSHYSSAYPNVTSSTGVGLHNSTPSNTTGGLTNPVSTSSYSHQPTSTETKLSWISYDECIKAKISFHFRVKMMLMRMYGKKIGNKYWWLPISSSSLLN